MSLKCAVCHRQPLPDTAPRITPRDLSLAVFDLAGTTRGAQDILLTLRAGIVRHAIPLKLGQASFSKMPPDFGTPLTGEELAALDTWSAATALPDVGGGTTPADGLLLYAANCQACHGVAGFGGLAINIRGADPTAIQTSIQIGISSDPDMMAWPGLAALTSAEQQAIATYLATP